MTSNHLTGISTWVISIVALAWLSCAAGQNSCTNPNRNAGTCMSVYDCPAITAVLSQTARTQSELNFLQQSQCWNGIGRTPHVCCTADKDYVAGGRTTPTVPQPVTPPPRRPPQPSNGRGNVLPDPPNCGPNTLADKIYGGNETALDEYPWMVLLAYRSRSGATTFNCGGSLINQRYVLTAAHCVRGDIETQIGTLSMVRLGEFDTTTAVDCLDKDCNNPVVEVDYEEVIPHPEFNPSMKDRHHDIALIRLAADVSFTDFIRPVCLPRGVNRRGINVGEELIVAGWGRTRSARSSNRKQQLGVPLNTHASCRSKFRTRNIDLIAAQICLGGEFAKDSCDGDSGGPLMRRLDQDRWFLEGIVSFGNHCGLEAWPGVYTRVADYVEWIQQSMKP